MSEIVEVFKESLLAKGASMVGIADLSCLPEKDRLGMKTGISIGTAIRPEVVRGLGNGPTTEYYAEYKRLNRLLNSLAEYGAGLLRDLGFKAHPQTIENVIEDEDTWRTPLPHKTVATRAGLGWIGNCALLVTEKYGSAVRLTSIITSADLPVDNPVNKSRCGNCTSCKDACPGSAVKGANWSPDLDRDSLYNAFDCRKTARGRAAGIGVEETICGMCFYICPWTQKYLKREA